MAKSAPYSSPSTNFSALPSAGSVLMASVGSLLVISLMMVASASIPFAVSIGNPDLYFFYNQLTFIGIGIFLATVTYFFRLSWFYEMVLQFAMLAITTLLLIVTLFGDTINGSKRWIEIGSFNFQTAELVKLVMVLFVADFVVRRSHDVRGSWEGFYRMFIVFAIIGTLLLLQPDFGSLVIIVGTIFAIFFVAGAPKEQYFTFTALATGLFTMAIMTQNYRLVRVQSFLDPFDDMSNTDYQLARSLIAFGRGEGTGVGYGESLQKLAHLPESHTDFLLAITGEELGFVGVLTVLLLQALVIGSTLRISYNALKRKQMRLSYTAFGFAVIFIGQTFVNAGMTMGVLPTKGLTMPFFSYGGSSMVVSLIMVGLLLKINHQSPRIDPAKCRHY